MNRKSFCWQSGLIALIVFVYVLTMSLMALWIGDDIIYRFNFSNRTAVASIGDIIQSQITHYHNTNGRTVAHFLVQFFIVFVGKAGFAIINASITLLLVFLIGKLCGKDVSDWKSMAFISLAVLLSIRTKYVPTCQIGYIWMFCLVLGFILLLHKYGSSRASWNIVWLVPFSLIAGWSQESLVVGVGAALVIYVLAHLRSVTLSQWVMIISFGIGGLLLCLAPSNIDRTGDAHASVDFLSPFAMSAIKYALNLRATYALLLLVLYKRVKDKEKIPDMYRAEPFWWNGWAVLALFNLAVGVFGNRQLFGLELISIILMVKMLKSRKAIGIISIGLSAALLCVLAGNVRIMVREQSVYDKVMSGYAESDDGTVYYDLSARDVTYVETSPVDVYSWFGIYSINRLLHIKSDDGKSLKILPVCCSDIPDASVIRNAKGSLCVVVKRDGSCSDISVQREFSVLGIRVPYRDMMLSMDAPIYADDEVQVFQIFEKVPFLHNTGVKFLK